MAFRPLHDRVLVRRIEADEKTAGGIIIPDSARDNQEKALLGEIIAVGQGAYNQNGERVPLDVTVGDRVYYQKWSGHDVKIDGEELKVIQEKDVIGIAG